MIECVNLRKVYNLNTPKEVVALKEANFKIPKGSLTLITGASGSGKSTLLALIGALTRPTSGKVIVDGEIVSKLPQDFASLYRREKVGFIFQKFHLIEELNALENVSLPLIPTSQKSISRAKELLTQFGLASKLSQPVGKLSGGEQQRVAIARSLINNPPLLLADEPTANLDTKLTQEFIETLAWLKKEGKTILVATHDPRFLKLDFIDKVLEVKEGYVIS